jgi:hypothetical protein
VENDSASLSNHEVTSKQTWMFSSMLANMLLQQWILQHIILTDQACICNACTQKELIL